MPAALAASVRDGTVPCNNDLLAANFIDDGERIWLIDYEYSGNNDACFELGNIAGECSPRRGRRWPRWSPVTTAGRGASKIARARLLGLAGMYGWTLWGAIQHAASPIDFDFWSWAMERSRALPPVSRRPASADCSRPSSFPTRTTPQTKPAQGILPA